MQEMQEMINSDDVIKENMKQHNLNWPQFPDHPYEILIVGGSGSRKTSSLLGLISHQPHIVKFCLYAGDPYEAKHQLLIKKRESISLKRFNDSKFFIECSNDMNDIYMNIEE